MAGMQWYKVYSNTFDNSKIKLIKKMPNGHTTLLIWFELLTLASKDYSDGVFAMPDGTPLTDEMIAALIDEEIPDVRLALKLFERFGMIKNVTDSVTDSVTLTNWKRYQSVKRYEQQKSLAAARAKKYRAKKKEKEQENQLICKHVTSPSRDASRDASRDVTQQNKNKNKNKSITTTPTPPSKAEKSKQENPVAVVAKTPLSLVKEFSGDNAELLDSLKAWLEMRQKMKRPLTGRATTQALQKLNELAAGNQDAMIQIVDQSTIKGWLTFYQLKGDRGNANALADVVKHVDEVIPDVQENPDEVKAWLVEEGLL